MKKTLAAVLAAAMALSTASVVLAKDQLDGETILEDISVVDGRTEIRYGKEYSFILSADVLGATDISATDLGKWVKNGDATVTVTVTEGMAKMASKPTATVKNVVTAEEVENTYKWNLGAGFEIKVGNKVVVEHNKEIKAIPVNADGGFTLDPAEVEEAVYPTDSRWDDLFDYVLTNHATYVTRDTSSTSTSAKAPVVQVKFKVADDWGTGTANIGMKFRITFKKAVGGYSKGDTVMADEVLFKATYYKMNDKGTEMELTKQECSDRYVLMNKDGELYDKIGTDEFTLYFENSAAFTGKMSPTQKALNMYYTTDEVSDVVNAYPDVDFEFIDFKGKPTFVNSGSMAFSAIGGKNTQVYTWDGEALTPLTGKYDSTYDTVTVKGIKKLGTYVIASEILEEDEPDEPAEPVSSAPVVEEPEEDENPKTGAC